MNIKTRVEKMEKARPQGREHLVWQNQGEPQDQAIDRFKKQHNTKTHDEFMIVGWQDE